MEEDLSQPSSMLREGVLLLVHCVLCYIQPAGMVNCRFKKYAYDVMNSYLIKRVDKKFTDLDHFIANSNWLSREG